MKTLSYTKFINGLLICSAVLLFSYTLGLFDTKLNLLDEKNHSSVRGMTVGEASGKLEFSDGRYMSHCNMPGTQDLDFCGIEIFLTDDLTKGIDLRSFSEIDFTFKVSGPVAQPTLRLTFRNYNDNYSVPYDPVSQKFNSIIVTEEDTNTTAIPIDYLHVETWWIKEQEVPLVHAQIDLENVVKIDILNHDTRTPGDYRFELSTLVLRGELISLTHLLLVNSFIWIIVVSLLTIKQRRHLLEQATQDRLTGLDNRRGLQDWIDKSHPNPDKPVDFSLIYIDLDDFKQTNDTFGHKIGDMLLRTFSNKTRDLLNTERYKKSDILFARMSGDEFVILIKAFDIQACVEIAEDLFDTFSTPLCIEDNLVPVSLSIGIASSRVLNTDLRLLFEQADTAMYLAKKTGKNQYKVHSDNVEDRLFRRKRLAKKISLAIDNNEFELKFMPTFHVDSKRVSSVEVLLCVNSSSELKKLSAAEMIDIAEEFNLINAIDTWVIASSFKHLNKNRKLIENLNIQFGINISTLDLQVSNMIEFIDQQMHEHNINPNWIEFEISETALSLDHERTIHSLHELKNMGFKLSLDNFGTGFNAFEQLAAYPIQKIKIDRSFVEAINHNDTKLTVFISAIMEIATAHNLEVTANGVENLDQFYYLKERGCCYIQGHLFSEPLSLKDLIKGLRSQYITSDTDG